MSNESIGPTDVPTDSRPRRTSFTSNTLSSIFGRSPSNAGHIATGTSAPTGTAPFPGPITAAAADQQRRRMSISTMGLSGTSPTQTSPFIGLARRSSVSTAGSESIDENAIDDEDGPSRSSPQTPFARRLSFGAQAFRAARGGGVSPGGSNGTPPFFSYTYVTSPGAFGSQGHSEGSMSTQASKQPKPRTPSDFSFSRTRSESYNWPEQLRSRAESSHTSHTSRSSFSMPSSAAVRSHERAKSVAEIPKPMPPVGGGLAAGTHHQSSIQKKPDAFQERMLKGDFTMD